MGIVELVYQLRKEYSMVNLLVNEIFDSYQGEGHFVGTPCTFVRLQGCSVGCSFCDTKHTWGTGSKFKDSQSSIILKDETPNRFFASMSSADILKNCKEDTIIITGGEPFEQDITELIQVLLFNSKVVCIETSGNSSFSKIENVFYTVSPKITKNTNLDILKESLSRASEVKIVPSPGILIKIDWIIKNVNPSAFLTFQPESCEKISLELCIALAKKYKGRVSIQTHKYVGKR